MKKLKIAQASSDCEGFMRRCGFRHNPEHPEPPPHYASHMIPDEGKEFFVYFQEPSSEPSKKFRWNREDWSGYDGFFTLVRIEDGKEVLVDTGYASDSHIHAGINTFTFYGKGVKLSKGTWSLHCEIPGPEDSPES